MMSKYTATLVLLLTLEIIIAQPASPARMRSQNQQQSVAPYPSAEELKPETPFEEGTPDKTYGPPDLTYGPPTDQVEQLPSSAEPQDFTPDPDAEEIQPADQAPALLVNQIPKIRQLLRLGGQSQTLLLVAQNSASPLSLINPSPLAVSFPIQTRVQFW